jgi:hypothetical protein
MRVSYVGIEQIKAYGRSVDKSLVPVIHDYSAAMRWELLFADLDAQVAAGDAAELAGEVRERTRAELARQSLADRLLGRIGRPVTAHLVDGTVRSGDLVDAAAEWVVLRDRQGDRVVVVLLPVSAVVAWTGLGRRTVSERVVVRRRHSLTAVLRAVARDRSPVQVRLLGGLRLSGTVDAVGADHFDLAEHDPDQPRRPAAVRSRRTVAFATLVRVEPAAGATSLG